MRRACLAMGGQTHPRGWKRPPLPLPQSLSTVHRESASCSPEPAPRSPTTSFALRRRRRKTPQSPESGPSLALRSVNIRRILALLSEKGGGSGGCAPAADLDASLDALGVAINRYNVSQVLKLSPNADAQVAFFEWAGKRAAGGYRHDSYAYSTLIDGLGRARRFQEAWELLEQMVREGLPLLDVPFNAMIKNYGAAKMADGVEQSLQKMKQHGVSLTNYSYGTLVAVYASLGRPEKALAYYEEKIALGHPPNDISLNAIIEAFCKAGKADDARNIINTTMKSAGGSPNVYCWTSLLSGFAKAGRLDETCTLFTEMQASGVAPNVCTYMCLIDSLRKVGKMDDAMRYYEEMLSRGLEPDCAINSVIVDGFCKAERFEEALGFFERLLKSDSPFFASAFYFLTKNFCTLEWSAELQRRLVGENFLNHLVSLESFSSSLTKAQGVKKALEVVEAGIPQGYVPNTAVCNLLVEGLCRADSPAEACRVFDRMMQNGMKPLNRTCFELIKALSNNGCLDIATDGLFRMFEANLKLSTATCNVLIKALCGADQLGIAVKILEQMETHDCPPPDITTFNLLIQSHASAGDLELSMTYYNRALRRGLIPDRGSYGQLIAKLCAGNQSSSALQLLEGIREKGIIPSIVTYTALLHGLSKDGKLDEACDVFLHYTSDYSDCYHYVIYKMLLFAFSDRPTNLTIDISKSVEIYSSLIQKLMDAGKSVEASKVLSEIRKTSLANYFPDS